MTDRYIRWSETQRFKWCRRSWLNGYYLGLTKAPDPAKPATGQRDEGTICDLAIRSYYHGDVPPLETWARLRAEQAEACGGELTPEWEKAYSLTERMLEGYTEWLEEEGADAGEKTVGAEVELTIPLGEIYGDDVFLIIHIDRIVIDLWGEWVIDDTKTVATFEKDEVFAIDDQLTTYAWAWSKLFPERPIRRAGHTMLRKVKRTGTAKPPFYKRERINFTQSQLYAAGSKIYGVIEDMVRVYQELDRLVNYALGDGDPLSLRVPGSAYPSPGRDCGWRCDFLPICTSHDDTDVDIAGLRSEMYVPYPERRSA